MRSHRVASGILAALAVAIIGAAWVLHDTGYETQPLAHLARAPQRGAPDWSRPCWRHNPAPYAGSYTRPCARVHGLVLYRQARDPDGDGDAHLIVAAGTHLVDLKFPHAAGSVRLPGPGQHVGAVGVLDRDGEGLPQVRVARLNGH